MNKYNKFYDAIDEIKDFLKRDLIGPISPNETLINEEPLGNYVMGILWPARTTAYSRATSEGEIDLEDTESVEDGIEGMDDTVSSANLYKPSTMGISFMINPSETQINFEFIFSKYTHEEKQGEKRKENYYHRKEQKIPSVFNIPSGVRSVDCLDDNSLSSQNICIRLHIRKVLQDGSKLATISVSNTACTPQRNIAQNEAALFQCELNIKSQSPFLPIYNNVAYIEGNIESKVNAMLYQEVMNYAYGHGCAAKWLSNEKNQVNAIFSEFMPDEQVLQMMPNDISTDKILYLKYWLNADRKEATSLLSSFIAEYIVWLKTKEKEAALIPQHRAAFDYSLKNVKVCIKRLQSATDILLSNDMAWNSFCIMNEAMLLQRVKTKKTKEDVIRWYPFQLAYILQIIPDIVDTNSPYRNHVDLLWFPTGGGKTEAYLGVAAFTIFYRRFRDKPLADGVAIFMRYTLRLLTIQQFERASALICSCEYLRKKYNISGGEINIGLWIGSGMTPNHLDDAAKKLEDLKKDPNIKIYEGNPIQITNCPWCGSQIDLSSYSVDSHMNIRCSNNPKCPFHEKLPIYIIDDDIYAMKPTLVLSTVDKFARIAWEANMKNLFGANGKAPELIIQDELHLISGPLGSLAGIYEIAVEALCSEESLPKIIASTATVKQADLQIKNLYNRQMIQFPPNGISANDSFFAIKATKNERSARTYVGLCENGGSLADLLIRVYANMLFIKRLFIKENKDEEVIDNFYTTVGYFNAIKDLGASSSMINDRVNSQIRMLCLRKFKKEADIAGLTPQDISIYVRHDELTSRKTAREIKETLSRLEKTYKDPLAFSYVLASNMLSVGIDINRLGVMTVYNQPKSNSEYIQATSRVGRQNPGLVLTMYNAARSRDKSHYEQFSFYHKSFYQYVESTSVTPFSKRAIEKALHCIFIAMVRHMLPNMSGNDCASKFKASMTGVQKIKDMILDRVQAVYPSSVNYADIWLEQTIEAWEELAQNNPDTLVYKSYNNQKVSLLASSEKDQTLDFPLILNSLRNVEENSNIFIAQR